MASFKIDATEIIKAYKQGLEAGFIIATDTSEVDEVCNVNGIDIIEDEN